MRPWTRREVLRSGLAAAGATALPAAVASALDPELGEVGAAAGEARDPHAPLAPPVGAGRERLLLDANWRFHLGRGADPTAGFNAPADPGFAKAGTLFAPSSATFDDSAWQPVDLPHDWAFDLPFVDDPRFVNWGFKPLYREYPENSIGWSAACSRCRPRTQAAGCRSSLTACSATRR